MTLDRDFDTYMRGVLENGHSTRPDADSPPPDTWQRVLAQVQPKPEEKDEMRSATLSTYASRTPGVFPGGPRSSSADRRGFSHYLNLAATIAIIATLAVGGWFAAMQVNQPGTPDPRFAVLSGTPEAASLTCDIEPLNEERVMAIVKNPMPFVTDGPTGDPRHISEALPESSELYEYNYSLEVASGNEIPTRDQFDSAEEIANEYLECLLVGTQGQVWNFYNPINIQKSILSDFPVFSSEEDVRSRIQERIVMPAIEGEWIWQDLSFVNDIAEVSVNPDLNLAILNRSQTMYFDQVLTVGVVLRDSDGKAMVQSNGTGRNLIPNDPMLTGTNDIILSVKLVKPHQSDNWLVIPGPSLAELGNVFD